MPVRWAVRSRFDSFRLPPRHRHAPRSRCATAGDQQRGLRGGQRAPRRLIDSLAISLHSNDFAEAQDAQRALAAAAALCAAARHAAGIDPELPGLLTTSEL